MEKGVGGIEGGYGRVIEGMEKRVGEVMEYVEKKKVREKSVVVLMWDNGGVGGERGGGEVEREKYGVKRGKGWG